ncbi:uncharacterized protein Dana_GF12840 [Drosophila ananassae]|uniref:Spondin-1 n=1 Tax=Drosophila ananassae TaxID=7217 RepID=B3MCA2_DROAN|nr:spondin-1 [Drosophila ananassae]EDV36202.1 uncharacterized protein Dana_GF12840 [Drosophila ananassae]
MLRRILLILFLAFEVRGACDRVPQGANGERSAVDDNFQILIDGNPETYIPDHQYNVSLSCPFNLKFLSFTLVIESEDPSLSLSGVDTIGHFELFSTTDTKFASGCENMVESTNTNAKNSIKVSWVAPRNPESGCVLIKAGIVQHRDVWFIDDGFLTKRICPEEIDELNILTPPLENCCACDEAKYEIVLERKWNRNTHSKYFPAEAWRTRFGEVIGASHSHSYRYWAYGGRASQGMKEMAEHGSTRTLENEIRENTQNGNVRTLIKAPGISHRLNVWGTTLANARVDPTHHQISLATKVDPSPDWILGVAGLELCLSNCTWLERKVLNLFPWDIGTDSGPSYMSPDQPQIPPDVIRRITSSYPSDYRSPFYDPSGVPLKPLATLYLTRKKLYVRECDEVAQEGPLECAVHPWNEWTQCSTRCGSGLSQRQRSYKNPSLAANYNCNTRLEETRQCQGTQCGRMEEKLPDEDAGRDMESPFGGGSSAECQLNRWSPWSPCSKTCGRGISTRTRDYYNPQARQKCLSVMRLPLEESRECVGSNCGGTIPDMGEMDALPEADPFGEVDQGGFDSRRPSWNNRQDISNPSSGIQSWNRKGYNSNLNNNNRPPYDEGDSSRESLYGQGNQDRTSFNSPPSNRGYDSNRRQPLDSGFLPSNSYSNDKLVSNRPGFDSNQGYSNNDYSTPYQRQDFTTRSPYGGRTFINQQTFEDNNSEGNESFNVVQDYCFQKPYDYEHPCFAHPLVVSNYWFYDSDDRECKIFTTDNCDENKNRFRTLMACEGTCLQPHSAMERQENNQLDEYAGRSYNQPAAGWRGPSSQPRGSSYNSRASFNVDNRFGEGGGESYSQTRESNFRSRFPETSKASSNYGTQLGMGGGESYSQTRAREYFDQRDEPEEIAGNIEEPMTQTRNRYDFQRRGRYGG